MKSIKILLLLLSLTACNNKTKTISTLDLEKVVINYKDLPSKVKERVFYGEAMKLGEENEERFQALQETNNPKKYEYYTKQDPQLAWVHYPYIYIRNKKTKQEYSIDEDGPMGGRYIIYGDSLYIQNHYDIYEKDSLKYTFTKYILR